MHSIRVPLTELQVGAHCARSQPAAKSKVVWMYEQIFKVHYIISGAGGASSLQRPVQHVTWQRDWPWLKPDLALGQNQARQRTARASEQLAMDRGIHLLLQIDRGSLLLHAHGACHACGGTAACLFHLVIGACVPHNIKSLHERLLPYSCAEAPWTSTWCQGRKQAAAGRSQFETSY